MKNDSVDLEVNENFLFKCLGVIFLLNLLFISLITKNDPKG